MLPTCGLWSTTSQSRRPEPASHRRGHRARYPGSKIDGVPARTPVAAAVAQDDDYLLTSDVDMIPLDRRWFNGQDTSRPFHVLGTNANAPRTHLQYVLPGRPGSRVARDHEEP